ncbi:tyrosine- kinase transmembrane receptor ROR1 [Brachionus plicatilis]|uniref:Tyrosine-kinase transmembrane receptor ROR1 n=1 Tax=Brachionus plicatilis TaxID=10195 RepID=A0A3M7T8M4_BRAPC|nr:tyrosine- kinase transmembrane receptor ROR1 [Brachionus plicatilis]
MRLQCIQSLMPKFLLLINVIIATHCLNATTKTSLHIKRPLSSNYSRRIGERVRLDCEFSVDGPLTPLQLSDISLYWIKNYQEIIQPKRGETTIIRRNLSTMLIMKNLETFDSGSYISETTLYVSRAFQQTGPKHESLSDYLLSDMDSLDDDYSLSDEFPSLNPTLVENFDDKGFCEPYRGSICSGIITSNYSVYSTSQQQQDLIEDRLKSIVPLLLKNNLSKRCSTFALPSLCLFAFPLCDRHTNQPKQICRFDCKQLQQDICKNEYFNVKSLFGSKLGDSLQSSLMLDCGQLPPSSDSPAHCLPIVSMTLEKLEVVAMADVNDDKCMVANGLAYRGRQAVTRNGYGCQRWDDQYPHMHQFKNVRQLSGHNYCRNPDNDIEPWCFTTNGRVRKDYCHIDKCGGSVKGEKSGDESMDEKRMAANRLRMSNMSLGKKNNFQKSCRLTESSKSSVVSSSGDAYRPYDNQHSGQFAQPMPPLPLVQHLPQVNECNMQMKHFHANQFRLVQELGKVFILKLFFFIFQLKFVYKHHVRRGD